MKTRIHPKASSPRETTATKQACQLDARGYPIAPRPDPCWGAMRLLVVPELAQRVNGLATTEEEVFREYDVRVVWPERLGYLADEIQRGAPLPNA